MTESRTYITYEDFGAVGDGITDDIASIASAHAYANEHSLPVKVKADACYYIGGKAIPVRIKTDTDFTTAKFIIDDRALENNKLDVFIISSDLGHFEPDIKSLKRGQKKIDFPHEGKVYVRVNAPDEKRVYIRKGHNASGGSPASDVFIVDGDGNILSPINWSYDKIASVTAFSVDDNPITVKGGIFTTIANQAPSTYNYHHRGIAIKRSHVTVENVAHYVEGELDHGAPYNAFIHISSCYDITIKNCLLTPHKTYYNSAAAPGVMDGMGSYDLVLTHAIDVKLIGIKQTIDIANVNYWGIMGSNFCKCMTLSDCKISRFDAHCGVAGLTVKNCEFGYAGFSLIGFGDCIIENSSVRANFFITLRPDYGSFFDGKVIAKNCTWYPRVAHTSTMIKALNSGVV